MIKFLQIIGGMLILSLFPIAIGTIWIDFAFCGKLLLTDLVLIIFIKLFENNYPPE